MLFLISLTAGLLFGALIFMLIIALDKMLNHAHQNFFKMKSQGQRTLRTPFLHARPIKLPKLI
ncbi:hypothetical protein DC3_13630 [Deinococcus cellulosilyticus NBRC 106333 = KACC 11606]|uniref:Uncharacterized protein n=2 Tax=Deinococcus cellulosilyticus TaxID=401558 RepID=A0A511MZQ8_DEIC1|nr:hypothetical protein DC3_13630 [Deinococcus cellulosilyticus NBRC 106333 = KACC 11606]